MPPFGGTEESAALVGRELVKDGAVDAPAGAGIGGVPCLDLGLELRAHVASAGGEERGPGPAEHRPEGVPVGDALIRDADPCLGVRPGGTLALDLDDLAVGSEPLDQDPVGRPLDRGHVVVGVAGAGVVHDGVLQGRVSALVAKRSCPADRQGPFQLAVGEDCVARDEEGVAVLRVGRRRRPHRVAGARLTFVGGGGGGQQDRRRHPNDGHRQGGRREPAPDPSVRLLLLSWYS